MKNVFNIKIVLLAILTVFTFLYGENFTFAADSSEFQITINPGTLSVDIVDGGFSSVGSPSVALNDVSFSFDCQTTTGVFSTSTQQIYIQNPDAADDGWVVSIAASSTTSLWTSAASTSDQFDYNDNTSLGCVDGIDGDSEPGRLVIVPAVATVATGSCPSCDTTGLSTAALSIFIEGTIDSITLLTAAANSDDIGDWTMTGINLSQSIPPEQAAHDDYSIDMILSIVAS